MPRALKTDRLRSPRPPDTRPSAAARGYDHRWQRERIEYLHYHPRCVVCRDKATVVDHIVPHNGIEELLRSQSNWQALCRDCHNRKTKQESANRRHQNRCEDRQKTEPPMCIIRGPVSSVDHG